MKNFVFENPTKIIFGEGRIAEIGREVRQFGTKALMVYGQGSIKRNGVYDQVVAALKEAAVQFVEYSGVKSNPVLSHVMQGVDVARREKVEAILAVGGGSVIDEAKTIAVGALTDRDLWEFFTRKETVQAALPVLTVLTVSASASEMNPAAVITKEDLAQKFSIRSSYIQPKTSVLDPTVLYSLSPEYSAYSAVDAITHMLEGYFNNEEPASPLQDALVEGLIHVIMESMNRILVDARDYGARADMMWAATLAFNGLTTAGVGKVQLPVHMIEHSLSALYDIAHGAGLSIVLPAWMRYAASMKTEKMARFARRIFGVEENDDGRAAQAGVARLKEWFAAIGSPTTFKEAQRPEKDVEIIASNAAVLAVIWELADYSAEVIEEILNYCVRET